MDCCLGKSLLSKFKKTRKLTLDGASVSYNYNIMDSKQNLVLSLFKPFERHERPLPISNGASRGGIPKRGVRSMFTGASTNSPGHLGQFVMEETLAIDSLPPGIGLLPKGKQFSVFKKSHAEEAALVVDYLLSGDFKKFMENAAHLKKILNEGIYMYAVSTAMIHHEENEGALLPPLWQVNPRSYFPWPAIKRAHEIALSHSLEDGAKDVPTYPPFVTGTHRDPEFKLAWWREDCALNAHHYHWHQVYPWRGVKGVIKERQGELFYYMHQQMLARYDAERLGLNMLRVEPYINWHQPIQEGYNPQLSDYYGTYQFAARPAGMILADNWRDPTEPTLVTEQEYHRDRLLDAINTGKFRKPDGTDVDVAIDNLGAAVEANITSPNPNLYGEVGIHNLGHDLLSAITDPDYRYQQAQGVMGDVSASIRDPIFFRWHKFIDGLFVKHKITLTPYLPEELEFEDITVNSLEVKVTNKAKDVPTNLLTTRMETNVVNIGHDMFLASHEQFNANTDVNVTVQQINHDEFDYFIKITNTTKKNVKAAIRIFMAPSFDEDDAFHSLDVQRRLCIEMDKFVITLKSGANSIKRSSVSSSVIKPRDLTVPELKIRAKNNSNNMKKDKSGSAKCACRSDRYCECGWPQHMLLPRGTTSGMKFDLFVMVTNWAMDSSTDDLDRGTSYCGVKDKTYPDKKAMGFPFDRKIDSIKYPNLIKFAESYSNMITTPIIIKRVDNGNS